MKTQIITNDAPAAVGPYSQAIKSEKTLYISGQLPIDSQTKEMCTGYADECAEQALNNIKAIVESAGGSLANVVKVTVLLTDMEDFHIVNKVYERFFTAPYPARSAFAVAALPLNGRLEIEAIAVLD